MSEPTGVTCTLDCVGTVHSMTCLEQHKRRERLLSIRRDNGPMIELPVSEEATRRATEAMQRDTRRLLGITEDDVERTMDMHARRSQTPMERDFPAICSWTRMQTTSTDALRRELARALEMLDDHEALNEAATEAQGR